MSAAEPSQTAPAKTGLNGSFRLVALTLATLVMGALSTYPTALAVRLLRLWQTGTPFTAKLVPGAALGPATALVCVVISTLSLAALAWGYTRLSAWLEQRTVTEFEARHAVSRLAAGLALGAAVISLAIAVIAAAGAAQITMANRLAFSSSTIVPVLVVPVLEELVFRGILFRIIEEMLGTMAGLAGSAILFGLAHLLNDNSSLAAAGSIAISLGVLLGVAYAVTRSLWLPIGLHAGWNFALGNLFGAADSGSDIDGFLETTTTGHAVLTGGAFGPEGSVITIGLALILSALLILRARHRGSGLHGGAGRGSLSAPDLGVRAR